jgi:chromosome segregation ATPase
MIGSTVASDASVSTVHALLQIIANPKAALAHLEEISGIAAEVRELHAGAAEANKAAEAARSDAAAKLSQAEALFASHDVKAKQISDHEGVLKALQDRLTAWEGEVAAREAAVAADLKTREENLAAREKAVTDREAIARKVHDEVQSLKEFWDRKTASLRAAIGDEAPAPKNYVLQAETGSVGATMGGVV